MTPRPETTGARESAQSAPESPRVSLDALSAQIEKGSVADIQAEVDRLMTTANNNQKRMLSERFLPDWNDAKADAALSSDERNVLDEALEGLFGEEKTSSEELMEKAEGIIKDKKGPLMAVANARAALTEMMVTEKSLFKSTVFPMVIGFLEKLLRRAVDRGVITLEEAGLKPEPPAGGEAEDESANEPSDGDGDSADVDQPPAAPEADSEPEAAEDPQVPEGMSAKERSALIEKINNEESFYTLMTLEEIQGEGPKAAEAKEIILKRVNETLAGETRGMLSDLGSESFKAFLPGQSGSEVVFLLTVVDEENQQFKVQIGDGETRPFVTKEWDGSLENLPSILAMEKGFELDAQKPEEVDLDNPPEE